MPLDQMFSFICCSSVWYIPPSAIIYVGHYTVGYRCTIGHISVLFISQRDLKSKLNELVGTYLGVSKHSLRKPNATNSTLYGMLFV